MRVPLFWLHDYCDPGIPIADLEHQLTMTGTKVEAVHGHGVGALEHFVVGRVLTADRHPDADRLTVCTVDVGEGEERQIVCGAPNVAAGQIVAVAGAGAIMPDGTKLKRAKLRGVESNGMILAEDEVAIGPDHDGIMVLDPELRPGTPLAEVLPIATEVLELEITPNRPDCLSIYGVAREVHAATGAPLTPAPWSSDPAKPGEVPGVSIEVQDAELCPRFTARLYEDVQIGPSPEWLKARLTAAGMRPINNVVDITNFVMLATGQPMHAFDFDLVSGGRLTVRRALDGETMTTLDDVERAFDPDMLIICDDDGPTSIAGIMGGERSEVRDDTTRVLMEAATWNGPNIQRTSTRLGLRSEASTRFEKQLQPEQAIDGQALAAILMIELAGARLVDGTVDVGGPGPDPQTIRLRDERTERVLGTAIPRDESAEILRRLEFTVAEESDGLGVAVPYFRRGDITREIDLVEEVARLWGLDKLPYTLPSRRGATGVLSPEQRLRRRLEDTLAGVGLSEVAGWVFTAPDLGDRLRLPADDWRRDVVVLRNPMSEDMSVLRPTLLGSLLDVAQRNRARGMPDVRLFEIGAIFLGRERPGTRTAAEERSEPLPTEGGHVGALLSGPLRPPSWREGDPVEADFFAVKAVLTALLDTLRVPWSVDRGAEPFLHPGRSASVSIDGRPAGWIGEVHPVVARTWDLERAAAFEVDLGVIEAAALHVPRYEDLTSYPAVLQDRAWWFGLDVPAAEVIAVVRDAGGPLLRRAEIFDVYPADERVSLAVRLEFRADDRTLTDEEVAQRRAKIDAAVAERLGGEPRG
jgi:phenylalanyl-tRNA synthetase beta chain